MLARFGRSSLLLALALGACACGGRPQPSPAPALAEQAADVVADKRALEPALAAGNDAVRAAGDCEALAPLVATARQRFDEVAPMLRTEAARATLVHLRRQVERVAETCP